MPIRQQEHQRELPHGPCVQVRLVIKPREGKRYKPKCLTTFWTHITYSFNRRTDEPFGPCTSRGCCDTTSRWQTVYTIRTLVHHYPVIPSVTFLIIADYSLKNQRFTKTGFHPWLLNKTFSQTSLIFTLFYQFLIDMRRSYVSLCYILKGNRPN